MELLATAWTAPKELVEEVLERGIVRKGSRHRRRPSGARDLHGPDVDDGGPDALGDAHEGRLERVRALDGRRDGLTRSGAAGVENRVDPEARAGKGEKSGQDDRGATCLREHRGPPSGMRSRGARRRCGS